MLHAYPIYWDITKLFLVLRGLLTTVLRKLKKITSLIDVVNFLKSSLRFIETHMKTYF